jgi:hypothetical protein
MLIRALSRVWGAGRPKPRKEMMPMSGRRQARMLCLWLALVSAALALLTSLVQFGEVLMSLLAHH